MQVKHLLVSGLLSLIVFSSCSKKDKIIDDSAAIAGTWVGKYSVLSEPYNNYYSFKIKAGGILELLDAAGQKTGEGTWEFSNANTVIFGTYTLLAPATSTFSIIANYDKAKAELDGTWGVGAKEYGGGYWYMEKSN